MTDKKYDKIFKSITEGFRNQYINNMLDENNKSNVYTEQISLLSATVSMTQPLRDIYSGAPVMFVSAYRDILSLEENKKRTKVLIRHIQETNFKYCQFNGYWSNYNAETKTYGEPKLEQSFMVVGKNRLGLSDFETFKNIAHKWCKEFDQDCVLIGKADREYNNEDRKFKDFPITFGFVYQDGSFEKKFTELHFDSPETIKKVHDYYINSKYNRTNETNFGYAYTTDMKEKKYF